MPTASDLLLNLSIQVEGEEGLKTLGEELKALEAEQFKYNKQAQQGTVITEKVEAATRNNKREFQRIRAEVGQQIVANRDNQEVLNDLNKAHGLLSDQIRMSQATIRKYGAETIEASEKQQQFANTTKELRSRLQAIKDRTADLQRSMKGSSEATAEQTLEFKRVSDRAKELERDAGKLAKKFGNNREETNAYRKVLVDVRGVQQKLNDTFKQSDSEFARLSKTIAGVNKEVNRLRSEFFESDLRAEALVDSNTDLAQANKIVEEENKKSIEVMKVQRGLLRDLREEVDALSSSQQITAQESEKLSKQLNGATQNAGVSQRALQNLNSTFGTSTQVQNRATQALISFSQGLQDAPQFSFGFAAGIRAIANNMTQFQQLTTLLGDSISETTGKTATFGQKLRALLAALKGPAGGLILFTAITSAVTFFSARMSKARKETEGLQTSLEDLTSTLTGYQSTLGSDAFGVDNLMLQKEALEDIQSVYEDQLQILERISVESTTLQKVGARFVRERERFQQAIGLKLDIPVQVTEERLRDLGIPEETARRASSFTREQQRAVKALVDSRRELDRQRESVGVSTKTMGELTQQVNRLNNQIEINNRLSALRPLGQRIAELNKQSAILQIRADFGDISVEQAENELSAIKEQRRVAKEALETALAREKAIRRLSEEQERFAPPLISPTQNDVLKEQIDGAIDLFDPLGAAIDKADQRVKDLGLGFGVLLSPINNAETSVAELTATQADNKAIIEETTTIIEIFERILKSANDERQRELDLEREKQLLTVDTQTLLALTIAQGIDDERKKAIEIFNIEKAALNRRTALRQEVAVQDIEHDEQYTNQLVQLRVGLHEKLTQIDQQNADERERLLGQFGIVDTARFQTRIDELTLAGKDYQVMRLESERDVEQQIQQIRDAGFNDEVLFDRMRANAKKAIEEEITEDKERNAKERQEIARQEALNNLSIVSQGLQNILGSFSQMSQQRAQASEKAAKREFENQKALSYATTVVAGAEAVVKALGNPLEVATAIAVTLAQLATISQQEFRASGTIGDGGSSGATSAMRTFSDSYGNSRPASRTLTRSDTLDTGRAPAGVAANQLGTPIVNVYNTANIDSKGLYLTTQHGRKEYERSTTQ